MPDKVARQVAAFTANPELGLSFMGFDQIDAQGAFVADRSDIPWRHPDLFVTVFSANPINGSTVMMPRTVLDEAGPFDEALRADVDAEMWFRVLAVIPPPISRASISITGSTTKHYLPIGASCTGPRRPFGQRILGDGPPRRRLQADDRAATPRILAEMSAMFTQQGLHDLGRALLVRSVPDGSRVGAQRRAAAKLVEGQARSG